MRNGICPQCQSRRVYAKHDVLGSKHGWQYIDVKVMSGQFLNGQMIDVVTYICVRCGHMSLAVVNTALPGLEEKLVDWGWSAIPAVESE